MIRWSYSQWYVMAMSLLTFIASATIAVNVAHGTYPVWAAWAGFLTGLPATVGIGILTHETRAHREDAKIHRLGG